MKITSVLITIVFVDTHFERILSEDGGDLG